MVFVDDFSLQRRLYINNEQAKSCVRDNSECRTMNVPTNVIEFVYDGQHLCKALL